MKSENTLDATARAMMKAFDAMVKALASRKGPLTEEETTIVAALTRIIDHQREQFTMVMTARMVGGTCEIHENGIAISLPADYKERVMDGLKKSVDVMMGKAVSQQDEESEPCEPEEKKSTLCGEDVAKFLASLESRERKGGK